MDKLELKGMRFFGYHGVYPEENRLGQQYIVDLIVQLDLGKAGRSDDLNETINYPDIYHTVQSIVQGPPFKLIEAVAEHIAQTLLSSYMLVDEVTVRVTKPHPPFDSHFDGVTVELSRKRELA